MVAQKFHHESSDPEQDQLEETEDTLSLCDLPIYGDFSCDDWTEDSFSKESRRVSSPDQDLFEFSSQDFKVQSFPSENIVFCGKIIPYKKPILSSQRPSKPRKQRGWLSRWMSLLFRWGISSDRPCVSKYGSLQSSSRWYLFVFGLSRYPVEMELRDIRTRQSRLKGKPPTSTMFADWTFEKKSSHHLGSGGGGGGVVGGGGKASLTGCMPLLRNS